MGRKPSGILAGSIDREGRGVKGFISPQIYTRQLFAVINKQETLIPDPAVSGLLFSPLSISENPFDFLHDDD